MLIFTAITSLLSVNVHGEETADTLVTVSPVVWNVNLTGAGATGDFAPYFIGSNSGGRHAMSGSAIVDASIIKGYDLDRRFSWTAGVELAAGYQTSALYDIYHPELDEWSQRPWRPAAATVYQLWAGVKYRGINLWAGMRDHVSPVVDDELSSGDLTLSNNARAIPQVEIGFVDYQNIPLTKGWVQIAGGISYGKYTNNKSLEGRYNYWNNHIALGTLFTYKSVFFRTRQDKPFAVTIGVQEAGEFGGTTYSYINGKLYKVIKNGQDFRAFWEMFIPTKRYRDGFVEGNHIGTWNLLARYIFKNKIELGGYFEWHWDDGSGMAKRNGWDGLWGLYLTMPDRKAPLKKVVVEYIDMTNQSGPIHWAPYDHPGTTITSEGTGGDDYYNSTTFNAWANYGLGLGSPFPVSPLYNTDGYPQYRYSRTRGFHIGATGSLSSRVDWKAKFSYGIARGNGRIPYPRMLRNTSALVSASWDASALLSGLNVGGSLAFDAGSLRGDNFGCLVNISYTGSFNLHKTKNSK